ncbi:MAG: TonB-dependent receptor plug domain-containing protein [Janthinobacterium lividum]
MRKAHILLGLASLSAPWLSSHAQTALDQFAGSSLEEVANAKVLVSTVSRKEEDVAEAPAAAFVITREDIARSSATTIPDLLRVVPGLQVAQISASNWAVSARGFNSAYANKLLVLVDGRTVYSEIYSGVHWDELDLPLDTIERIEIIRGPGAAVWGANAVNGVINIITRPAREAEGVSVSTESSRIAEKALLQFGGSLGDAVQYRAFASYTDRRPLQDASGQTTFDGMALFRFGGRLDYQRSLSHSYNLLGDIYRGRTRQQIGPFLALSLESGGHEHDSIAGAFLQASSLWTHAKSTTDLHTFFGDNTRVELSSRATTRTGDIELVNHSRPSDRFDLVWGGEGRYTYDHTSGAAGTQLPTYNNYLVSGFLQADYALKPHVLTLTVGTKLQDGSLTGVQAQPSVRLMWLVNDHQSVWAAVSRAVVAPSLQDKAISVPLKLGTVRGLPIIGNLLGSQAFKPEEVVAFEGGYRRRFTRNLSTDVALYVNRNRRLQSLTAGTPVFVPTPAPYVVVDELYTNAFSGISEGVEAAMNWKPSSRVHARASYSWTEAQIGARAGDPSTLVDPYSTARNTASGDVAWSISKALSFDALLYRVGNIAAPNSITNGAYNAAVVLDYIPAFTRLDTHLKAALGSHTVLEVGGTNLLQARHVEFGSSTSFLIPLYVPRSVFVRARWSF